MLEPKPASGFDSQVKSEEPPMSTFDENFRRAMAAAPKTELRKVITDQVTCPTCTRSAGWPCVFMNGPRRGQDRPKLHTSRIEIIITDKDWP